jgi:hypothetical protein
MGDVIDRLANENAELKAEVKTYRTAISFETTCLSCAGLLDRLSYAENIIAELTHLTKEVS